MSHYRLFFHNGIKISHAINIDCEHESDLDKAVADHADGRPMELWLGEVAVRKYPATDGSALREKWKKSSKIPSEVPHVYGSK
jgi:hypothetical protein